MSVCVLIWLHCTDLLSNKKIKRRCHKKDLALKPKKATYLGINRSSTTFAATAWGLKIKRLQALVNYIDYYCLAM